MAIKHATTKEHGEKGYASEWNEAHTIEDNTIITVNTNFANQELKTTSDVVFNKITTTNEGIHKFIKLTPINPAPAPAQEGYVYVDSVTHHIYCYLNGVWKQLDNV